LREIYHGGKLDGNLTVPQKTAVTILTFESR